MTDSVRGRDFGLDLLRAVAALGVLCAHSVYFVWPLAPDWSLLLYVASASIDAFFVLAGFLLGRAWLADPGVAGPGALLRHRLWRIAPLYLLFVAANVALAARADGGWQVPWAHLGLVQNLDATHGRFMPEAWNLAVWAWFMVLACALFAAVGRGPRAAARLQAVALVVIATGIALRAGWVLAFDPAWDDGVKKVVLTRLDACAYGLLAAAAWALRPPPAPAARLLGALGALLVLLSVAAYRAGPIDQDLLPRVLPFVLTGSGFALLLPWLLALRPWPAPGAAAVTALARGSYALYLVHFPLIRLIERDWVHATTWSRGLLHVAVYVACALLSAAVLHRWVERPLRLRDRA
jgi:peptidoglycan/LPS O-acetylase OafA/YrhL